MIAGIILAAGASSRMGRPKALLEYRGETFTGRLVRVLSKFCDPVIVVLGYHADAIRESVVATNNRVVPTEWRHSTAEPLPVVAARGVHSGAILVVNPDPDRGQLSSLQTALGALPDQAAGFLFTPVDSPTVDEKTVATLVEMLGEDILIPRYQGRRGHPVCVPRSLAGAFLELAPTAQTRAAIDGHSERVVYVDVDDPGILADIDDLEAYRALKP